MFKFDSIDYIIFGIILVVLFALTINTIKITCSDSEPKKTSCEDYADYRLEAIPAKCVKYFTNDLY